MKRQQRELTHTAIVLNRSDEPIEVVDIRSSCACTKIEPRSFKLLPGEQQALTLSIDVSLPPIAAKVSLGKSMSSDMGCSHESDPLYLLLDLFRDVLHRQRSGLGRGDC